MWNLTGYMGETDFVNVYGGGLGGFSFYNVSDNTQIYNNRPLISPIARIDNVGDFVCNGSISCGGSISCNWFTSAQLMAVTLNIGNPSYAVSACGLFSSPLPSIGIANNPSSIGPYIATSNGYNGLLINGAGGYGGSANMLGEYWGTLVYQTSSRKYKHDIQLLKNSSVYTLENFMKLEPVIFGCLFNGQQTGENSIGIIAEDVDDIGLPELVSLREGVVDGIHYSKLPIFIIKIVQEQQIKIEEQQNTINSLQSVIDSLTQRITAIESVVYKN